MLNRNIFIAGIVVNKHRGFILICRVTRYLQIHFTITLKKEWALTNIWTMNNDLSLLQEFTVVYTCMSDILSMILIFSNKC